MNIAEKVLKELMKKTDNYQDVGVDDHIFLSKEMSLFEINTGGYSMAVEGLTDKEIDYLKKLRES